MVETSQKKSVYTNWILGDDVICRSIFYLNYKTGLEITSSFFLFLPFSFFGGIKQEREKRKREKWKPLINQ